MAVVKAVRGEAPGDPRPSGARLPEAERPDPQRSTPITWLFLVARLAKNAKNQRKTLKNQSARRADWFFCHFPRLILTLDCKLSRLFVSRACQTYARSCFCFSFLPKSRLYVLHPRHNIKYETRNLLTFRLYLLRYIKAT